MKLDGNQPFRLCVEIAGPSPLGALLLVLASSGRDGIGTALLAVPYLVGVSYAFGILPSILYAGAMGLWFVKWWHLRYGLIATVAYSSVLGLLSGLVIQEFLEGVTGGSSFLAIGAFVGVILGVLLHQKSVR